MTVPVAIVYRDFHDVPRLFGFTQQETWFVCDCPFDDVTDNYPTEYFVYRVRSYRGSDPTGEWSHLKPHAELLGRIPVDAIRFDESRRASADVAAIAALLGEGKRTGFGA